MKKRTGIYYEFYKNGVYKGTGFETLTNTTITTGVDTVPTLSMTIPLKNLPEKNLALYDVIVHFMKDGYEKYTFYGVVDTLTIDYANYNVAINLSHYVSRMRDWLMPSNYTVKNFNVEAVIGENGAALGHSDTLGDPQNYLDADNGRMVNFVYLDDDLKTSSGANGVKVSLTFSAVNKLEALSEVLKYTEDVHFRVSLTKQNTIEIGRFGESSNIIISPDAVPMDGCESEEVKELNTNYLSMLTEPTFNVDYTNHFNRAVVFCGDVGYGILHLTLKQIYENPSLQIDGFPVGMYDKQINQQPETEYDESKENHPKINNEKIYSNNEGISFAENDNREYYVTDTVQLNRDGGVVRCNVYNFSDMYPIPDTTGEDSLGETIEYVITDDDRLEMSKQAYWRACRALKSQRPEYAYSFNCTAIPNWVGDGDKLHFVYTKKENVAVDGKDEDCGDTERKTTDSVDEELFMNKRVITFDDVMNEINTITLDLELRYRQINAVEVELHELASEKDGSDSPSAKTRPSYKSTISFQETTNKSSRDNSYADLNLAG